MASILAPVAFASIAALFPAVSPLACINESKPRAGSDISEAHLISVTPADLWAAKGEQLINRLARLKSNPSFDADPDLQNDFAVTLIRLARAAEAIPVLEALERQWPGRYQTASNLGAAYEHTGNNELALKWVSEGLRRNPGSHAGTEWLHVRILEAKIARARDPDWLATHSIYDGGAPLTGSDAVPAKARAFSDSNGVARSPKEAMEATAYQLNERMRFARPPEAIVAELLLELASVAAVEKDADLALPVIRLAGEFKPVRASLYEARRSHLEAQAMLPPRQGAPVPPMEPATQSGWLWEILALLVLVGIVAEAYRRTRRKGDPTPA